MGREVTVGLAAAGWRHRRAGRENGDEDAQQTCAHRILRSSHAVSRALPGCWGSPDRVTDRSRYSNAGGRRSDRRVARELPGWSGPGRVDQIGVVCPARIGDRWYWLRHRRTVRRWPTAYRPPRRCRCAAPAAPRARVPGGSGAGRFGQHLLGNSTSEVRPVQARRQAGPHRQRRGRGLIGIRPRRPSHPSNQAQHQLRSFTQGSAAHPWRPWCP